MTRWMTSVLPRATARYFPMISSGHNVADQNDLTLSLHTSSDLICHFLIEIRNVNFQAALFLLVEDTYSVALFRTE